MLQADVAHQHHDTRLGFGCRVTRWGRQERCLARRLTLNSVVHTSGINVTMVKQKHSMHASKTRVTMVKEKKRSINTTGTKVTIV